MSPRPSTRPAGDNAQHDARSGATARDVGVTSVAGVTITHPDRVVFPDADDPSRGVTKAMLARYIERVAPRMLPHVAGRPLSLVRCPQGQEGTCFYQKHWTTTLPPGVERVEMREESGARAPYVLVREVRGLVALVQHGVLEVHPWGARADTIEHPDRAIFDLDPAPDVAWWRVVVTAQRLRTLLRNCGLASWVKTTGGKGLHVVVPLAPTASGMTSPTSFGSPQVANSAAWTAPHRRDPWSALLRSSQALTEDVLAALLTGEVRTP